MHTRAHTQTTHKLNHTLSFVVIGQTDSNWCKFLLLDLKSTNQKIGNMIYQVITASYFFFFFFFDSALDLL